MNFHGGNIPSDAVDLSANIFPEMNPAAAAALRRLALDPSALVPYPEPDAATLRSLLGEFWGLPSGSVVVGAGACDLISLVASCLSARARAFAERFPTGSPQRLCAAVVEPAFTEYARSLSASGFSVRRVASSSLLPALLDEGERPPAPGNVLPLATLTPAERSLLPSFAGVSLVFAASPANPTGLVLPERAIFSLARVCAASGAMLVLDSCFARFSAEAESAVRSLLSRRAEFPNVIVLSAFTKFHGMAGLRLGYALCLGGAGLLSAHARPWAAGSAELMAGEAVVRDAISGGGWAERVRGAVAEERRRLCAFLSSRGIPFEEGGANFVLFRLALPDLEARLLSRGVAVRCCADFPTLGPDWHRAALRLPRDTDALVRALSAVLDGEADSSATPAESSAPSDVPSASSADSSAPSGVASASPADSFAPSDVASASPAESSAPNCVPSASPSDSFAPNDVASASPAESSAPSCVASASSSDSFAPSGVASASPADSVAPSGVASASPADSVAPKCVPSGSPADSSAPKCVPSASPSESSAPNFVPSATAGRGRARPIMVQGTASNAGKSVLVAALCRIFREDGLSVAPFKSQNMALNSAVTADGLEVGRAQAVQAAACGLEPSADMNPILLKPTGEGRSQVVVMGVPVGEMGFREYAEFRRTLVPKVMDSFGRLSEGRDVVVVEGAGSPAEINLRDGDIVNMGLAEMLDSPVLLAADIDRGGALASLYGTAALVSAGERRRIRGFVVNRFRGDASLLAPGLSELEAMTGIPTLGVVPFIPDLSLDGEDSLADFPPPKPAPVRVCAVRLPFLANLTDLRPLASLPFVSVEFASSAQEIASGGYDLLVLPGTKNAAAAWEFMSSRGIAAAVRNFAAGGPVLGICGGLQLLGGPLDDPDGVEGGSPSGWRGCGLLPVATRFRAEKTRRRVDEDVPALGGAWSFLSGLRARGYELHHGVSRSGGSEVRFSAEGNVFGTYVHGLFGSAEILRAVVAFLAGRRGVSVDLSKVSGGDDALGSEISRLAAAVRASLDMGRVYEAVFGGGR